MSYRPQSPTLKHNQPLSKSTTEFFSSQSAIDQFISQFFLPKKHDYSQNVLQFYSNSHNFTQKNYQIPNCDNDALCASLFYKSKLQQPPQNCIVYCHGFGSTRLQAVHILKVLTEQIALCCFDFSGSGKSQGSMITYGAKEKDDIHCVLTYLKQKLNFKHFVLWGRSMGATACLLYSIKYQQSQQLHDQNVIFQIVDSPFYSFERISLELAKKFISMPYFGTNIVLDMMKKHCSSLNDHNPFIVSLENIHECKVPTLFVYSQNDQIVACQNSQEICSKFTAFYQKIIIPQNHNAQRTTQTLSQIIKKIQIQLKKYQISKKNGIVFRSFISNKSHKSKSHKKGIERSLRKQNSTSSIYDFSKPSSIHQIPEIDHLKIDSKCQTPNPHSTDNFFNRKSYNETTEYFSSKPISYSTLPHRFSQKDYQSPFIQSPRTNQNQYRSQPFENLYQMKKPQNGKYKTGKQLKRYFSPIQNHTFQNPLTNFSRQEILHEKSIDRDSYRDSHRKSYSTSKKLNISLSKLKNFKQRTFAAQPTPKQSINHQDSYQTGNHMQKNTQSSQFTPVSMKTVIRPISQCKNESIKSILKTTTPTTKATSVSSSMDNLRFLGAMQTHTEETDRKERVRKIFEKERGKGIENDMRRGRESKKVDSSQNIYFDKNVYKYGF